MKRLNLWLSGVAVAALMVSAGAQTWTEQGDAGDLPSSAQTTVGVGALTQIDGNLTSSDAVDMYLIKIVDPLNFSASTTGGSYTDLQFHLFQTDGTGLLNNDDWDGVRPRLGSGVPVNGSIDWSAWAQANLPAGNYLLAISYWPRDPRNSAGQDIWNETPWSQQRTPDGPGAPGPIAGWDSTSGVNTDYHIVLAGVEYAVVPEPASMMALGVGLAGLLGLRRRARK